MWARDFKCCQGCGTVSSKHMAKGLCNPCYQRKYKHENFDLIQEKKRLNYILNRDLILAELKRSRDKYKYDGMREVVLERDGFRCTMCGDTEKLTVHHQDKVVSVRVRANGNKRRLRNNNLANLVTLCRKCHLEVHRDDLLAHRTFAPGSYLKMRGQWSYSHEACRGCGTKELRHAGRGLCFRCYNLVAKGKIKI